MAMSLFKERKKKVVNLIIYKVCCCVPSWMPLSKQTFDFFHINIRWMVQVSQCHLIRAC